MWPIKNIVVVVLIMRITMGLLIKIKKVVTIIMIIIAAISFCA